MVMLPTINQRVHIEYQSCNVRDYGRRNQYGMSWCPPCIPLIFWEYTAWCMLCLALQLICSLSYAPWFVTRGWARMEAINFSIGASDQMKGRQMGTKIDECIVGPLQLCQFACRHGPTAMHAEFSYKFLQHFSKPSKFLQNSLTNCLISRWVLSVSLRY